MRGCSNFTEDNVTLLDLIGFIWLALAVGLILWLKVLSPSSLRNSPPRHSTLSVIHLAGVFLLYIGTMIMAGIVCIALFPSTPRPAAAAPSTIAAATTTAPATDLASQPSTNPEPSLGNNLSSAYLQIISSFTSFIAAALILILAYTNVTGRLKGWGLSFTQIPGALWRGALAFFITMPLMLFLQQPITYIMEHFRHKEPAVHTVIKMMQNDDIPPHIKLLLTITAVVIAPIVEEMFFRGFLQTIFIQPNPFIIGSPPSSNLHKPSPARRWIVILIVAAIFASIHFDFKDPNLENLPLLFLLGTALGYTYERTGNLWASITLHALFNGSVLATLPHSS